MRGRKDKTEKNKKFQLTSYLDKPFFVVGLK
jgi:hypothetical protein